MVFLVETCYNVQEIEEDYQLSIPFIGCLTI